MTYQLFNEHVQKRITHLQKITDAMNEAIEVEKLYTDKLTKLHELNAQLLFYDGFSAIDEQPNLNDINQSFDEVD